MRARPTFALLTFAAAAILAGSCYWAWTADSFWKPLPLYPAVLAAGILALLATYSNSGRLLRAIWMGGAVALITLAGTALITLVRWEI